jgi:hypothetical protein
MGIPLRNREPRRWRGGHRARGVGLLAVAMLACGGCGAARTTPVTGAVLHKGKPVSLARVMFSTAGAPVAVGLTDDSGRYSLSTFRDGDGAVPGPHRVTVQPVVRLAADGETPDPSTPVERRDIPLVCQDFTTTPLRVEVVAGRANSIDLDLKER